MFFSGETIERITSIMDVAAREGRNTLYEFEVYEILRAAGLEVPKHIFVRNPSELNENALSAFDKALVMKVVSPQITHKQKVGGVKVVNGTALNLVRDAMLQMERDVLSCSEGCTTPHIEGFLLVEFISFSEGLGYEVMLGIKQDDAFGPVITLTKGGDDAEFFATYYDPANLIIPPLDERALDVTYSLKIRHKFEAMGQRDYLRYIAQAARILGFLAYTFSALCDDVGYVIEEMDVNPFVFTKDQRFVAVDGFARFEKVQKAQPGLLSVHTQNLETFFTPQGIAVIGVSADMDKQSVGREIATLLHNMKREDIYLVNNKGGSLVIDGREYCLYKSMDAIEKKVDLIVYAAPAQFMIDFFKSLPKNCPQNVILISGIPFGIEYSQYKQELDAVVPSGTRIIGPNCMGVFYGADEMHKGVNTLFISEKKLEVRSSDASNTVLLTQSGALAVSLLDKLRKSRIFKAVVSFGNKYDIKPTDLIAYFAEDESMHLITLYIEGFEYGEGRTFFELAKTVGKPIIVYKAGKTEAGARAAASHTASISGSYEVFKAACAQAGVILAEKIEDYLDFIKIFSLLARKSLKGKRVAGVCNAGFESTISADELNNLEQAQLSGHTIEKLRMADKTGLVDLSTSFLDITPGADDGMYADYVEAILQDDGVDCVFVAVVPHAVALKTLPENCRDTDSLANRLAELSRRYSKPMVISVNAGRHYQEFISVMEEQGLPIYGDVRSAIKSLERYVSFNTEREGKKTPNR
ncbi:MAG: acetate--CoA ligase family protein [Bacillota bacterium]